MSDQSPRGNLIETAPAAGALKSPPGPRGRRGLRLGRALSLALAAGLSIPAMAPAAESGRSRTLPGGTGTVLQASRFSFGHTVLRSDVPVIVDFWAPWCISCRQLDGPMSEAAAKLGSRARVVRVNVEWSGGVARRYGVQALPAILVFKDGEMVSRLTGGASAQEIEELVTAQPEPSSVAAVTR